MLQYLVRYAIEANIIIDTIKQQLSSVDQYSIHIADYSFGLFEFSLTCIAVNPSLGGITQIFRVFYWVRGAKALYFLILTGGFAYYNDTDSARAILFLSHIHAAKLRFLACAT